MHTLPVGPDTTGWTLSNQDQPQNHCTDWGCPKWPCLAQKASKQKPIAITVRAALNGAAAQHPLLLISLVARRCKDENDVAGSNAACVGLQTSPRKLIREDVDSPRVGQVGAEVLERRCAGRDVLHDEAGVRQHGQPARGAASLGITGSQCPVAMARHSAGEAGIAPGMNNTPAVLQLLQLVLCHVAL